MTAKSFSKAEKTADHSLGMEPAYIRVARPKRTMSKRQQQTAFLKALVLHGNAEERARLQERMIRAERDEKCAWRALWLVSLLAVFSCCGICYTAVLVPQFFYNSSNIAVKVFCGLGLASMICAVAYLGFWFWCRAVLNRVQEECRRFIMATLEPGSRAARGHFPVPDGEPQAKGQRIVVDSDRETAIFPAPHRQTYTQLFSLRRVS